MPNRFALLSLLALGACAGTADPHAPATDDAVEAIADDAVGIPEDWARFAGAADAVFEGVVVDIVYRESTPDADVVSPIPHAFVTYEVIEGFKGVDAGDLVTLRVVGGPASNGQFLKVSETPDFDLGEHDILFVVANGETANPLVGGTRGRLRIHDGRVYTEGGREVLDAGPTLRLGAPVAIPDIDEHVVGTRRFARTPSVKALEPADSYAVSIEEVRGRLGAAIAPGPRAIGLSVDADAPFTHQF